MSGFPFGAGESAAWVTRPEISKRQRARAARRLRSLIVRIPSRSERCGQAGRAEGQRLARRGRGRRTEHRPSLKQGHFLCTDDRAGATRRLSVSPTRKPREPRHDLNGSQPGLYN